MSWGLQDVDDDDDDNACGGGGGDDDDDDDYDDDGGGGGDGDDDVVFWDMTPYQLPRHQAHQNHQWLLNNPNGITLHKTFIFTWRAEWDHKMQYCTRCTTTIIAHTYHA